MGRQRADPKACITPLVSTYATANASSTVDNSRWPPPSLQVLLISPVLADGHWSTLAWGAKRYDCVGRKFTRTENGLTPAALLYGRNGWRHRMAALGRSPALTRFDSAAADCAHRSPMRERPGRFLDSICGSNILETFPTRQCVVAARSEVLREAHGPANDSKYSAVDPHDGTPRYSGSSDCNNYPSVALAWPKHVHSSTRVRQTMLAFVW